jgi:hypothetical protein
MIVKDFPVLWWILGRVGVIGCHLRHYRFLITVYRWAFSPHGQKLIAGNKARGPRKTVARAPVLSLVPENVALERRNHYFNQQVQT